MGNIVHLLVVSGLALGLAAHWPGVRIGSYVTAVYVAGVYGIINLLAYDVLVHSWSLPLLLGYGLCPLVLNILLLFVGTKVVQDFEIRGSATIYLMALALTAVAWIPQVMLS